MRKLPKQCAACRKSHGSKTSVLCPACSKRFDAGERVQCDGFVLQRRKRKGAKR